MAIRYRITKRKNTISAKNTDQYIMQAVSTGTIDLDALSYEISNECTLSKVDIKMVLVALGDKLKYHLENGKTVDLETIGKFKVGFKCKAETDAKKLTPKRNIEKYHLNFQPCVELKRRLKKGIKTYKEGSRSK
jgi:predicted histone-like DNA-binding protein